MRYRYLLYACRCYSIGQFGGIRGLHGNEWEEQRTAAMVSSRVLASKLT
jgi:hypothetical protein